jgi:hypothetical protein
VNDKTVTEQDFVNLQKKIPQQRSDPQVMIRVRDIVVSIVSDQQKVVDARVMMKVLDAFMLPNSAYRDIPNLDAMILVLKGLLFVDMGDVSNGYDSYHKAILLNPDIDKALAMVSDLGNHGYRQQALQLLGVAEAEYVKQPDLMLAKPRAYSNEQIVQLRQAIQIDLKNSEDSN